MPFHWRRDRRIDMSTSHLIRQSCRAVFRAITAEQPAIVMVRRGRKVARCEGYKISIEPGQIGVLPARVTFRIENQPSQGRYIASALLLDDPLLIQTEVPNGNPMRTSCDDRLVGAFERAVTALDDPLTPPAIAEHSVRETLLWLAEEGIGFGPRRALCFVDKLRTKLAAEPDTRWRSIEAARAMAVSEATMRRRLAEEGTTFGDLLADVRMTQALGLLQTTELPINRIALDVGYACPSRFAKRFRARFGVTPSAIRSGDSRIMSGLA